MDIETKIGQQIKAEVTVPDTLTCVFDYFVKLASDTHHDGDADAVERIIDNAVIVITLRAGEK